MACSPDQSESKMVTKTLARPTHDLLGASENLLWAGSAFMSCRAGWFVTSEAPSKSCVGLANVLVTILDLDWAGLHATKSAA